MCFMYVFKLLSYLISQSRLDIWSKKTGGSYGYDINVNPAAESLYCFNISFLVCDFKYFAVLYGII